MKLKKGEEITINVPFTYTIGEEGGFTGKELNTIEDCIEEVEAEIDSGELNSVNLSTKVDLPEMDEGTFIVIELFGGVEYAHIEPKVFDSRKRAQKCADDYQYGLVVEI